MMGTGAVATVLERVDTDLPSSAPASRGKVGWGGQCSVCQVFCQKGLCSRMRPETCSSPLWRFTIHMSILKAQRRLERRHLSDLVPLSLC